MKNVRSKRRGLILACGVILGAVAGICVAGYEVHQLFLADPTTINREVSFTSLSKPHEIKKADPTPISRKPSSVSVVEYRTRDAAKHLLAKHQYEAALSAAKAFYNVAELSKTRDAVSLLASALAKARGTAIANQFRQEQLNSTAGGLNHRSEDVRNILSTIRVPTGEYEPMIQRLQKEPEDFESMIACGNLLLLTDRIAEAKTSFEFALQDANEEKEEKPERTAVALEGLARAIRDESLSAQQADSFIFSLRQKATGSGDGSAERVRAAAIKLATSGVPMSALVCSSEDPQVKAVKDPALARWLARWQATFYSDKFVADNQADILNLLDRTRLTCLDLAAIGRVVSFRSSNDWVVSAFYASAAMRASHELSDFPNDVTERREILVSLVLAKPILWRTVDNGDRHFVNALYILNRELADQIPADDAKLSNAKIHGSIGAAECLWLWGKDDDALKTLKSIEAIQLTAEQIRAAAWIRGLIKLSEHRYAEAGPAFKIVTSCPKYTYTEDAYRWLAVCLARCGKAVEADRAFDDWVRNYHPDVQTAAHVLELMGGDDSTNRQG
jgi:tetratricopeptide (TPR) repeat protein